MDPALIAYSRRLGKGAFWEKEDSYISYLFDESFKGLIVQKNTAQKYPLGKMYVGLNTDAMKSDCSFSLSWLLCIGTKCKVIVSVKRTD